MKRIVTGVNENGKSHVVSHEELGDPTMLNVWNYDPADIESIVSAIPDGTTYKTIEPVPGGATAGFMTIPPIEAGKAMPEPHLGMDEDGWHVTRTLDLVLVISGEITLGLDEGDVRVGVGDVVVQRATRHRWRNERSASHDVRGRRLGTTGVMRSQVHPPIASEVTPWAE